jgi:hypothetical protein
LPKQPILLTDEIVPPPALVGAELETLALIIRAFNLSLCCEPTSEEPKCGKSTRYVRADPAMSGPPKSPRVDASWIES